MRLVRLLISRRGFDSIEATLSLSYENVNVYLFEAALYVESPTVAPPIPAALQYEQATRMALLVNYLNATDAFMDMYLSIRLFTGSTDHQKRSAIACYHCTYPTGIYEGPESIYFRFTRLAMFVIT